jgi:hypothetical protein
MSLRRMLLLVFTVGAIALGPALTLPVLSAHSPTFTADTAPAPHGPLSSPAAPLAPMVGMAIKVKDVTAAAKKFKDRASAASGDYSTGVAGAASDWEAKSAAAEETYKSAVIDAAGKGRYGQGVRGSAGKYQKNATGVGPQRYQTGIANAQDGYAQAMGPVLSAIAGLTLPPRGVKGTNQERSNIVATALRKLKVGS